MESEEKKDILTPGKEYTISGILSTMRGEILPVGTKITFLTQYEDEVDKNAGEIINDPDFGRWNVYVAEVDGEKHTICTVPNSEGDKKARGKWISQKNDTLY